MVLFLLLASLLFPLFLIPIFLKQFGLKFLPGNRRNVNPPQACIDHSNYHLHKTDPRHNLHLYDIQDCTCLGDRIKQYQKEDNQVGQDNGQVIQPVHIPIIHDLIFGIFLILNILVDHMPGYDKIPEFLIPALKTDTLVQKKILSTLG